MSPISTLGWLMERLPPRLRPAAEQFREHILTSGMPIAVAFDLGRQWQAQQDATAARLTLLPPPGDARRSDADERSQTPHRPAPEPTSAA